jgi:hypothetical protein
MTFKYRTIGYTPEYAVTNKPASNEFNNLSTYIDGSKLKIGGTTGTAILEVTNNSQFILDVTKTNASGTPSLNTHLTTVLYNNNNYLN